MKNILRLLFSFAILIITFFVLVKVSGFVLEMLYKTKAESQNQANEYIISEFNKDKLTDFTIAEKSFGEKTTINKSSRVNFMTIKNESLSINIKVPKELYDQHKKGDNIRFYLDDELTSILLHESMVLVSIFE